jgi:hypothetical protein
MQDATSNFVQAITGAGRVRADQLLVDWSSDGLVRRVVYDDFDRTIVDHWRSTTSGHAWGLFGDGGTVADANWDVAGGVGTISVPTAPAYRLSLLPTEEYGDNDYQVDFRCPAASGANLEVSQLFAGTTAQTYIHVRLSIIPGGQVIAQLVERLDGSDTILSQATLEHTHDASTWYTYRLHRYGRDVRARVWASGTREPFERWDLQALYEGDLSIGFPGLRFGAATGNLNAKPVVCEWRNFRLVNGQFDDMSRLLGSWTVDHHLDDGLPDQVSFVSGTAVPSLRADILRPGWVSGRGRFTNRQFFSPYNAESPIYGFDRDVAPTALNIGVVTEAGREYLPVFTGQMDNIDMRGDHATLRGISAARQKLAKLIQPPAVYGLFEGANATWAISYALAACEVYASPPPQEGCRWWAPMHGSIHSFIPAANNPQINIGLYASDGDDSLGTGGQNVIDAEWIEGPFVSAPYLSYTDDRKAAIDIVPTGDGQALEAGDDLVSQAGNTGKFEMWVRGDATNNEPTSIVRLLLVNDNGTSVDCIIGPSTRIPTLIIDDNTTTDLFEYSQPLPTDGEWHFLGFAWKIDTPSKRWINLDGVVETDSTAFSAAGLPATEDFDDDNPRPIFRLPVAELQLTAGPTANPDDNPWLNEIAFTAGAQIVPSSMAFASIAERAPREAWEYLTSIGLSELAMLRIDEEDVVRYLGFTHWGMAAQQSIVDVLDSATNMAAPDANVDPTKIRNAVTVQFSESFNVNLFSSGLAVREVYELLPGITLVSIPTDEAIAEIRGYSFDYVEDADTTEPTNFNFVSVNSSDAGTGSYATSAQVVVEIVEWDPGSVTIQFDNQSPNTWYTANDKSWATVNVAGKLLVSKQASATEQDVASVASRGERGMAVNLPIIQRRYDARRVAKRLRNALARPVPTIGRIGVRGDPRRQPGDLVSVVDVETAIDGQWRIQSVFHDDDGALYSQEVTLRQVKEVGVWGVSKWGQCIWGENP